jgi:hypothetical protein
MAPRLLASCYERDADTVISPPDLEKKAVSTREWKKRRERVRCMGPARTGGATLKQGYYIPEKGLQR